MATNQALRGLDNLELRPAPAGASSPAGAGPQGLGRGLAEAAGDRDRPGRLGADHARRVEEARTSRAPARCFSDLWQQMQHGMLWATIGWTLRSAVIGYFVALIIGSVVGLLVARIPPLRAAVGSIITALQTMPSVVWAPFAIVLFGENNSAILFVVILGAAPSIANGLINGVDYTPPLLLRAGKTMGLRGFALYRYLILPASLPAYVAGMKQGWAFAWRSLMAAELFIAIIGQISLGQQLERRPAEPRFRRASARSSS